LENNKMGERYIISGVQLGLLCSTENKEKRKEIIDNIIDKQFIGSSSNNPKTDAKKINI